MWGTNECGIVSLTGNPEVYNLPRAVGRPTPGFTVEVVNERDEPVPAGEIGRVRVSSPTTISGYLDDPEATAKAFRGEWFYPGDLAAFTSDGQLVHHGRADDMMIVNGISVYPAEVEECLRGWPDVRDTVVLPVPHPILQQSPIAVVALDEGSQLSPADLLLGVQKKLGAHCLHDLVVVPQIPRSEHGKLARERLQPLLRAIWGGTVQPAHSGGRYGDPFPRDECLVTFTPPAETRSLGPWLDHLGGAPLHPAEDRPFASAGERWLREVLLLHSALLQTLGAPVFEPIASGSCTRLGTAVARWQARCILPCATLVPPGVARDLLAKAFALAEWASNASPTEPCDRSKFFAEVNRLVVEPYRQLIPAGRSTFGILKEASRRNVPWLALPGGVYQLGWGSRARRIDRSTTDGDSAIGRDLAQDKRLTAALLRAGGLPAPVHEAVSTVEEAKAAAERIGFPLVLKPIDQDRGEGVIVDVGPSQLEGATQHLLRTCASGRLLVERQVPGVCHRLFIAKGQVLYAVKRLPAGLVGDGKSSIEQLAARAGAVRAQLPPWRRSPFPGLDAAALQSLKRQGLTPTSMPGAGQFIALRRIESTLDGGVDVDVTHVLHPENRRIAVEAAALLGLEVAGVDIISRDISEPWHVNGAIINEVNFAPLLGVGDVSRSYVGKYLDLLTEGQARIPVHVFIGGSDAAGLAEKHRLALQSQGSCTFLLTPEHVTGPDGDTMTLEQRTLGGRVRALLLRPNADAILVVASTLEEWSAQPWVRDPASIKIVQHAQGARDPAAACDA